MLSIIEIFCVSVSHEKLPSWSDLLWESSRGSSPKQLQREAGEENQTSSSLW